MRSLADMTHEEIAEAFPQEDLRKQILALNGKRKEGVTAPGQLGLPERLDAMRILHRIPDHCFSVEPYLDRCLVWQISRDRTDKDGNTFLGDTNLIMTARLKDMRKNEAPYGILIGAGLEARATLESNGIRLGDTVVFLRSAPFRLRTGWDGTEEAKVIILQSGDLVGSLSLRERLNSGEETVMADSDDEGAYYYLNSGKPRTDQHFDDF